MHKRSFIMGIGIGIIVGVLMLELFTIGQKSQEQLQSIEQQINNPNDTESNNSVENIDTEEQLEEQDSPTAPINNEVAVESPNIPEVTGSDAISPIIEAPNTTLVDAPQAPNDSNSLNPEERVIDNTAEQSTQYVVRIRPRTTLSEAATLLESNGIITSVDEFVNIFLNNKKNIRAGYFLVHSDDSIKDLHHIFTDTPLIDSQINQKIEIEQIKLIE